MFLTDDCSLLELWILQSSKWQKADTFGRTLEISHLAKYFSTTQCLLLPLSDLKKVIERARREALKLTLACHWVCPQRMTVGYSIHNLSETWLVQGLTTRKQKKVANAPLLRAKHSSCFFFLGASRGWKMQGRCPFGKAIYVGLFVKWAPPKPQNHQLQLVWKQWTSFCNNQCHHFTKKNSFSPKRVHPNWKAGSF